LAFFPLFSLLHCLRFGFGRCFGYLRWNCTIEEGLYSLGFLGFLDFLNFLGWVGYYPCEGKENYVFSRLEFKFLNLLITNILNTKSLFVVKFIENLLTYILKNGLYIGAVKGTGLVEDGVVFLCICLPFLDRNLPILFRHITFVSCNSKYHLLAV